MPRVYGYMDTDTGVFTPAGQEVQYNPPQGQVAYSAYNQQPQGQQWQGQGYRANTGRQRQYQQWQGNGYRVNVGQPRFSGNGYAPRGYNTNMNYGPWYGQQSYATYPPYAPYQPRYEWMPGFNGQATAVRLGEYQREQPVAYEMMYNSQGVPVRVPVYAPMNNSAMPVRVGVSPDGQPYGSANVNYRAAFPQQQQTRNVQRLNQTSKTPPQGLTYQQATGINRAYMNTDYGTEVFPTRAYGDGGLAQEQAQVQTQAPVESDSREALIQAEMDRLRDIDTVEVQSLTQNGIEREPKTTEELRALAEATVDRRLNIENNVANSQLRAL